MHCLHGHLLDNVLFRIDLRSLAMMRCTNRSLNSHITYDPCFKSQYFYRIGSGLLHISTCGSNLLGYHPYGDSRSQRITDTLMRCHIMGSCSGLLLLYIGDSLCVANPLTKMFRFLNHSTLMAFASRPEAFRRDNKKYIGFAVDQIDRATLVHIIEDGINGERKYRFEINAGNSWRLSKTKITCPASDLDHRMKTPVYLDGYVHWLRKDGSIVAFNLETEKARLIPILFPLGLSLKALFAAGDNSLTLISATKDVIYVYALENILSDPKWVLVAQIRNVVLDEKRCDYWNVEAYDGKRLLLRENRKDHDNVIHVYDLSAKEWKVRGSVPRWSDANRDVFQFTPSLSSVGLDQVLASDDDKRISSLSSIMGLIDGISSEIVERQLRKRCAEAEEKKIASMAVLVKKMMPSFKFLYEYRTNKKTRVV